MQIDKQAVIKSAQASLDLHEAKAKFFRGVLEFLASAPEAEEASPTPIAPLRNIPKFSYKNLRKAGARSIIQKLIEEIPHFLTDRGYSVADVHTVAITRNSQLNRESVRFALHSMAEDGLMDVKEDPGQSHMAHPRKLYRLKDVPSGPSHSSHQPSPWPTPSGPQGHLPAPHTLPPSSSSPSPPSEEG